MRKEKRIINGQEVMVTVCNPASQDVSFQVYSHDNYLGESPLKHKATELEVNTDKGWKTLTRLVGESLENSKAALEKAAE